MLEEIAAKIRAYLKKAQWLRFKGASNKYEETYYIGYSQALEMTLNLLKGENK